MIHVAALFLFITSFYQELPESMDESAHLLPYLQQPYTYCGKGAQVVAYESQDGKYVLKLFKARHEKSFKLKRAFDLFKKESKGSSQKWKQKFQETTHRYRVAFENLREETGLIELHFEKTPHPLIVNIEGRALDISDYAFIIQKKAILTPSYVKHHSTDEAKAALKDLFKRRLEKGYSDLRQALSINYGFIDGRAVQIDVGKIEPFSGDQEKELERIYAHVDAWFSSK